jgi:hypothetical protein
VLAASPDLCVSVELGLGFPINLAVFRPNLVSLIILQQKKTQMLSSRVRFRPPPSRPSLLHPIFAPPSAAPTGPSTTPKTLCAPRRRPRTPPRVPDHGRRSHPHRSGRRAFRFGNLPIQSIQSWSRRLRRHPPRPVATSLVVAAVNHPITVAMAETGCRLHQDRLPPPSSPRRLAVHIDLVRQPPSALPLQPPHPHHLDGGWVVASRTGS